MTGDEHNLAFQTRYSLFKPTVMHLGMMNTIAKYQGYIDNAIREVLDDLTSAYSDDILIHCNLEDKHVEHVKLSMPCPLDAGSISEDRKM